VWILWLSLGPFITAVTFQVYLFLSVCTSPSSTLPGTSLRNFYTHLQTGSRVRAEGMIISLVLEHALRIRLKAETTSNGPSAAALVVDVVAPTGGDIEQTAKESDLAGAIEEEILHSRVETVVSGTRSASVSTSPSEPEHVSEASGATLVSAAEDNKKGKETENKGGKTDEKQRNLIGRINNLVTSDLYNITEARDFLFIVLHTPLNIALGAVFLYAILGWRCVESI
jgi:hypothetical protein